jgi:hypothetical protein
MLFLDDTPNTVAFMLAGYAVLLGFPILYGLSWVIRRSGLNRDLDMLKAMQAEKDAAAQSATSKAGKKQP